MFVVKSQRLVASLLSAAALLSCGLSDVAFARQAQTKHVEPVPTTPINAEVPQDQAGKRLFLWKVSNGTNTVYLLGSIHLVKPDLYPLPGEIENAFNKSAVLVLEVDESKHDPAALQQMMMAKGLYHDGDSLDKHVSKETNAELQKYVAAHPSGPTMSNMRPWFAGLMIPMLELQKLGFDPEKGLDKHFLNEAVAAGKPTDEVETADFQLRLMAGFSDDLQEKLLKSALIDAGDTQKDADQMMKAWSDGSPDEMEEVVTKDEKDHPELEEVMEKIVYQRNQGMLTKIEQYLKGDKPYFVAVGSAHLVGKRGLLQLLKDKKYTVSQVMSMPAKAADK